MTETKIQSEPFIPKDGMYVHDLETDHDAAIDRREITGEDSDFNQPDASERTHITDIHEDDVHEKPNPLFHNAGLYDEAEGSGGSLYDEATGERFTGHKTEEELAQDIYGGHVAVEHAMEEDATDAWLKIAEANRTNPDAMDQATADWIAQQKREL